MHSTTSSNRDVADVVADLATERGTYTLTMSTVGEYLSQLGLYNVDVQGASFDPSISCFIPANCPRHR